MLCYNHLFFSQPPASQTKTRRWVGWGDNGNEEEQGSCRLMPLFLSFLKRNPGVTLDTSSILAHKSAGPKLPHEPQRLLEKSESGPWSNFWRFLFDARTQMGRTLWALLQEKQQRPHPLFKMNPHEYFKMLDMHGALKTLGDFIQSSACGKKEGWAWLGALAREKEFYKACRREREREKRQYLQRLWSILPALNRGRKASMWSG